MIIGTFTKNGDSYEGNIESLTLRAMVTIDPVTKRTDKSPDYRIFFGAAEIGAAWNKTSKKGNGYLAVSLDDPSFSQPVACVLTEYQKGAFHLIWNR